MSREDRSREEMEMKERSRVEDVQERQDKETSFIDKDYKEDHDRSENRREKIRTRNENVGSSKSDILNDGQLEYEMNERYGKDVKRKDAAYKRKILHSKKEFFIDVLQTNINKKDGPEAVLLLDNSQLIKDNNNKVTGLIFKEKRIMELQKNGKFDYSASKSKLAKITEFKELLKKANIAHQKTMSGFVEHIIGVDNVSQETTDSVKENVSEKINEKIKERVDKLDPEASTSTQEQDGSKLTIQEIREFRGVLKKGKGEEITKERGEKIIRDLNIELEHWEDEAKKDGISEAQKETYKGVADTVKLKIDDIRVKMDKKPLTKEVQEMVKEETKTNELTKFEKFKEWVKTLGKFGFYATALGAAITSIVVSAKALLKKSKDAFDKFVEAIKNFANKAGPVVKVILQVAGAVLSLISKGLGWLAEHMWVLFVAIAYVLYNEFKSYRAERKNK